MFPNHSAAVLTSIRCPVAARSNRPVTGVPSQCPTILPDGSAQPADQPGVRTRSQCRTERSFTGTLPVNITRSAPAHPAISRMSAKFGLFRPAPGTAATPRPSENTPAPVL
ncbi:hypothetical protein [Arthrobacter sp. CJ23]|uniref:hypothetical protein n=1 Tax=Arthrobacter sp. CJ23 TaxID=2972479 RepID=UPI00215D498A|nr:hypothetical protein [Arthrobacter sp. CJ23]UVJ37758.1 hypothetical protein NVV90_10705 [Arthrobacter sp. CJ23]